MARKTFEQKQQELIDKEVAKANAKMKAMHIAYLEKVNLYLSTLPEPVRKVVEARGGA